MSVVNSEIWDVVIIGAGAAGLMCAAEAGRRGRRVLVLEHANRPGKKILMSGGGRCNFTNLDVTHKHYISHNPHFCKSALSRYSSTDFIAMVERHRIPYHEKAHGQLFCDNKASDIVNMLLKECERASVEIRLQTRVKHISQQSDGRFLVKTDHSTVLSSSLVVATGGLSIPTMGASPFGYEIAKQFGLNVYPTYASLVPVTWHDHDKEKFAELSGVSIAAQVTSRGMTFNENILFTHRGMSGPAILQISNFWLPGDIIDVNLLPSHSILDMITTLQDQFPKRTLRTILNEYFPKRLVPIFLDEALLNTPIKQISKARVLALSESLNQWQLKPNGTEGYRTAEVTMGGVDTDAISSKTMEAKDVPGLFFIGEVLDVTGWLGGYNFQWAWASAVAAGQHV